MRPDKFLKLKGAPSIPGLKFRHYSGSQDFPGMYDVYSKCCEADSEDMRWTLKDLIKYYSHLANCDLSKDSLIAEINGKIIAYTRVW